MIPDPPAAASPEAAIEATGLVKSFGGQPVLRGVDLAIPFGGSTAITGASGSGKSTLMAILGLLAPRDGGTLSVLGIDLPRRPSHRVTSAIRRRVAWLPQLPLLLPGRTCLDNALVGIRSRRAPVPDDVTRATDLFARLGVEQLITRDVSVLSGGEQQKLALIRALVVQPELILADEPTASLDEASTHSVISALREASRLATLVVASHDPAVTAASDRVVLLRNGQAVSE